ncbi:hypothetical protein FAZ69_01745 [Trinickia terrae]|uniref:FAD-dependent urate hydroxylase HpyO/Asp monooxygenase CreE-like FAD/NAD(P)-binding domain-containing protein n=1 Tax=Trinickia terrae TaxID=2571161 RepID=A0A4U1IFB9_9BURK|nr:FAD/NAD(P)-binding protein [Trinickia terrae]TKC92426.1 hypothetical protein FAZ69_01745 [Trinickia terrae]
MNTSKHHERFTIGVVGGGAASVAFLYHLTNLVEPSVAQHVRIRLFEPRPSVGPGLAYQHDVDSLLLNRAVETMSVSAGDFSTFTSWMRWKAHHEDGLHELTKRDLSATYVPRALFGRYLRDFFQETATVAQRKGLAIDIVPHEVRKIKRDTRYQLIAGSDSYEADIVVLAIGNISQRDIYRLSGHACYVPHPYPLAPLLARLGNSKRICILGAGLTAVDVAISLYNTNRDVEIHMMSPTGTLPYVKGRQAPHRPLRFITQERLRALTADGTRKISLRALGRLLRAEFRAAGTDWRELFARTDNARDLLGDEIAHADRERPWQTILVATNDIVEDAWHALDARGQFIVLERFARQWLTRRAPMPLENARLLARMLDDGQLKLVKTPVMFDRTDPSHLAMTRVDTTSRETYDCVINATGSARYVEGPDDSPLGWQLLQDGLASPDPRGGLRVDFDTGALLDSDGEPDWQFRALGHLTSGTYFFVSSLEMVAKRARKIAADLASSLSEEDLALRPASRNIALS